MRIDHSCISPNMFWEPIRQRFLPYGSYLNAMCNLQLIILDIDVLILQYVLRRRSKLMGAISEKLYKGDLFL